MIQVVVWGVSVVAGAVLISLGMIFVDILTDGPISRTARRKRKAKK